MSVPAKFDVEALMKIVKEITPIPPLRIVVSKLLSPECVQIVPPRTGTLDPKIIFLGAQSWKDLLGQYGGALTPGEFTIQSLTGVPVEFSPFGWRP